MTLAPMLGGTAANSRTARTLHHISLAAPAARRSRRALASILVGIAAVTAFAVEPAAAAPRPAAVAGDGHSPVVAALATSALAARDTYAVTGEPGAYHSYQQRLDVTADALAAEFATDPAVVRDAFDRADLNHQTAVLAALSVLGAEYRYATSDPSVGFDCSGLTAFAWARAGVQLPHQSSAQMHSSPRIDGTAATAGDLAQYPGHVMMYLGFGDAIVHAANAASDVELSHTRGRSLNWADPTG
jgi:cell wall-associated NlpC family hydrolase